MVTQMDDNSMALAVQGLQENPNLGTRAIVSCRLQKTDRYDHRRHFAHRDKAKREQEQGGAPPQSRGQELDKIMPFLPPSARAHRDGEMLKIWDFVLVCDDGTEVYLHPDFSKPNIAAYTGVPEPDHELPRSGKGGSSGPGTYKYFKNKQYQMTLKFDKQKRPH